MDQVWYYEDHGRAKGPVTAQELVKKIKLGEITLVDLVFKEGDAQWMPIQCHEELTELVGNVTLQDSSDWIVLKTVNVDGKNISEQIGPFNATQILDLLDKGKIRFSDYVWRKGYEQWVPLGRVDEFEKPLKSSVPVDASLYTKPRHFDLLARAESAQQQAPLKKVTPVVVQRDHMGLPSDRPAEARGEDLSEPKWKVTTTAIINKMEVIHGALPEEKESTTVITAPHVTRAKQTSEETPLPPQKYAVFNDEKTPPPVSSQSGAIRRQLEEAIDKQPLEIVEKNVLDASVEKLSTSEAGPDVEYLDDDTAVFAGDAVSDDHANSGRQLWNRIIVAQAFVASGFKAVFLKAKTIEPFTKELPEQVAKVSVETTSSRTQPDGATRDVQRRWVHVGVVACVMVILFALAAMMSIGKKKLDAQPKDQFSIKLDAPAPEVQKKMAQSLDEAEASVATSLPLVAVDSASPQKKKKEKVVDKVKEISAPLEKVTKNPASTSAASDLKPSISGSFKNKSYYHHKERTYIFYTANEGERLAADLHKATKKHEKSSKQWKSFYGGWKGKAKTYASKVGKDAKKARLHRKLFHQLATSAIELRDVGRDLDAQISSGRGPSKVASAKSLESQFKTINKNAKSLDR